MRTNLAAVFVLAGLLGAASPASAQNWSVGMNMGLSVMSGSAGYHMTPVAEFLFHHNLGIGSEFSANTQYSSPIIWYPYFKYYFSINGSGLRPYANVGPVLTFHLAETPRFGVLFGGGVNIPVAGRLYLTPDLLFGPLFNVGGTTYGFAYFANYYGMGVYNGIFQTVPGVTMFVWSVRGGVRYEF